MCAFRPHMPCRPFRILGCCEWLPERADYKKGYLDNLPIMQVGALKHAASSSALGVDSGVAITPVSGGIEKELVRLFRVRRSIYF